MLENFESLLLTQTIQHAKASHLVVLKSALSKSTLTECAVESNGPDNEVCSNDILIIYSYTYPVNLLEEFQLYFWWFHRECCILNLHINGPGGPKL